MADGDVLRALEPYIQAGNTGTVMFVFGDNSLGRIYLESGVPISARYRNSEGLEALDEIRSMDIQTIKFHEGTDIVRSMERLETNQQVEDHLNQPSTAEAARGARPASRQRAAPAGTQARAPAPTGPLLSPASRQILQQLLSDYIGPVAPLVMGDLPAEVDIETALAIVSREIDDPQRATEFIITARQSIG